MTFLKFLEKPPHDRLRLTHQIVIVDPASIFGPIPRQSRFCWQTSPCRQEDGDDAVLPGKADKFSEGSFLVK
jgi:hypothetical protein